jgi:hypothetical protein
MVPGIAAGNPRSIASSEASANGWLLGDAAGKANPGMAGAFAGMGCALVGTAVSCMIMLGNMAAGGPG